jgi:hypothetical protein
MQTSQLKSVVERQGLNDQAMAALFKIMKLDHALLSQDEIDKDAVFLMASHTEQEARANTRVPIETSLDREN